MLDFQMQEIGLCTEKVLCTESLAGISLLAAPGDDGRGGHTQPVSHGVMRSLMWKTLV